MPSPDFDRMINRLYHRRLQPRDFFYHADDRDLKKYTAGSFPAKVVQNKNHPVFVLAVSSIEASISPCTSHPAKPELYRSINPGCLTKFSSCMIPEATTYIVEDKSFPGPLDLRFWTGLTYHGQVPENAINGKICP